MQSKNKYFEYAVYMCNMQVLITKWYIINQILKNILSLSINSSNIHYQYYKFSYKFI